MAINNTVQTPDSSDPSATVDVSVRLDRIEKSLDRLSERLPEKKEVSKSTTKSALAVAFGLVGLKVIGFLGAKIGLIGDFAHAFVRYGMSGVDELNKIALPWFFGHIKPEERRVSLRFSLTGGVVGMVAGIVGGAYLGWRGGDRLSSPGELFSHPIDSIKKILSKKDYPEERTTHQQASDRSSNRDIPKPKILSAERSNEGPLSLLRQTDKERVT